MEGFDSTTSDRLEKLARACFRLKVLPLPNVVVFPGTPAPFHLVEPGHRALVADALASDRVFAVATPISSADGSNERTPLHEIATAGFIEHERRLDDGGYDLFFRAVARVRLVTEHGGWKPYREYTVELLQDVEPSDPAALSSRRAALEASLQQLRSALPSRSNVQWLVGATPRITSPSALADVVAAALLTHPDRRLAALAELDVARRLDLVTGEIATLVEILSPGPTATA